MDSVSLVSARLPDRSQDGAPEERVRRRQVQAASGHGWPDLPCDGPSGGHPQDTGAGPAEPDPAPGPGKGTFTPLIRKIPPCPRGKQQAWDEGPGKVAGALRLLALSCSPCTSCCLRRACARSREMEQRRRRFPTPGEPEVHQASPFLLLRRSSTHLGTFMDLRSSSPWRRTGSSFIPSPTGPRPDAHGPGPLWSRAGQGREGDMAAEPLPDDVGGAVAGRGGLPCSFPPSEEQQTSP